MKRMCLYLAVILVIALCFSACESKPSEKQASIKMTIAESGPSIPAFEYKDEKPYCFYAFDAEGRCYRVLWTDFEGLKEKMEVFVKYAALQTLTDDAPLSGWTPKYEITATQVRNAAQIVLYRYSWDGWGISSKIVGASDVACNIAEALENMKETHLRSPKISDDIFQLGSYYGPAERGTLWIEYGGKIYRMTPDLSQVCLVDTHFGEGKLLAMPEGFVRDVSNAWHYAPYDYYLGTYNPGDKTVELTNVFEADSTVQMRVKAIYVESNYDPKNTITLELISEIDQELRVGLDCRASADNLGLGDSKTLQMKKNTPVTVELTFSGWHKYAYWIYIGADKTVAEIKINPQ